MSSPDLRKRKGAEIEMKDESQNQSNADNNNKLTQLDINQSQGSVFKSSDSQRK